MKLLHVILFVVFCIPAAGQSTLQGRVLDSNSGKPIPAASVFLNNTSIGNSTDEQGYFQLKVPAGRFDLIVSSIGYETWSASITTSAIRQPLSIRLLPNSKLLEDVVVEPFEKNGWEQWGRFFLEHFIGSSALAKNCVLRNKEALRFRNSKKNNELTAHALEPLLIENRTLGYTIVYHLENFRFNFKERLLFYEGYPYFKKMKGGKAQQNRWEAARSAVYQGSMMHFMRALYHNRLVEEGFEVRRLMRKPDPGNKLVNDSTGNSNSKAANDVTNNTSGFSGEPDYIEVPGEELLPADSIAVAADSTTVVLLFEQYLQVTYKNKAAPEAYYRKYFSHGSAMTSQITLLHQQPVMIQANGLYYEPTGLLTIGYWSWSEKIATLLPFDFYPKKE